MFVVVFFLSLFISVRSKIHKIVINSCNAPKTDQEVSAFGCLNQIPICFESHRLAIFFLSFTRPHTSLGPLRYISFMTDSTLHYDSNISINCKTNSIGTVCVWERVRAQTWSLCDHASRHIQHKVVVFARLYHFVPKKIHLHAVI